MKYYEYQRQSTQEVKRSHEQRIEALSKKYNIEYAVPPKYICLIILGIILFIASICCLFEAISIDDDGTLSGVYFGVGLVCDLASFFPLVIGWSGIEESKEDYEMVLRNYELKDSISVRKRGK